MPFLESDEYLLLMDIATVAEHDYARYPHIKLDDLKLLRAAGIKTTLPFECDWSQIQPSPRKYDWSSLDKYVETAFAANMKVILFTPTYGYPEWFPNNFFAVDAMGAIRREALSPWNPEALQARLKFTQKLIDRYSEDRCMVVSAQMGAGETTFLNEPAFYDPFAIKSLHDFGIEKVPTTRAQMGDPNFNHWYYKSLLEMIVPQQKQLAAGNRWNEIFMMLHPAIADMPYWGNGCNYIDQFLTELTRNIPGVKINHIYYTWVQWEQYWPKMREWRIRYNENVFGGAEYAEGLPTNTPKAKAQGLRGQIIAPCYPRIHDNGVEPWMLKNIEDAIAFWRKP